MKRIWRIFLVILTILLLVLLLGPFLIPIPPLEGVRPVEELADPDSHFVEINGVKLHYKEMGEGERAFILLHGFAASVYSWREAMAPLAEHGRVVAFDRPAFGLTERPLPGSWSEQNPYSPEAQTDLTVGLMDYLDIERAILVGNSAGGTVAVHTTLRYPERVEGLILISPAIYTGGGSPGWIRPLLRTPQMQRLGPLFVRNIQEWGLDFGRSAWHNPDLITDEMWAGYTRPLQAENWDVGLWQLTTASRAGDLAGRLDEITLPVLVATGDDDRIVPTSQSARLAEELAHADLLVIEECGHVAHEECPEPLLEAIREFLNRIR